MTLPYGSSTWGAVNAAVISRYVSDIGLLREQYPSMSAWVDQIAQVAGETFLWNTGFQYGDWLDPTAPPERPSEAQIDTGLVVTAYLAHSAGLVAEIAGCSVTSTTLPATGDWPIRSRSPSKPPMRRTTAR
ncbi:alpha-L-rhamnosidase [Nonomuraea jiangxiensis]|uniref:Alpha-L-rhamnosidase n=1 Tax=Nonomuraea jiangxiensis TaxID=633440 RepID=A0A1G9UE26_9ACTN|nr:alpha-L-rhamnosidase [Nonomuraea jiangxiensis]